MRSRETNSSSLWGRPVEPHWPKPALATGVMTEHQAIATAITPAATTAPARRAAQRQATPPRAASRNTV